MSLHDVLDDLAGQVAPADLLPRVTRGVRRRRQRRAALLTGTVAAVAVVAVVPLALRSPATTRLAPAATTSAAASAPAPVRAPGDPTPLDVVWVGQDAEGRTHLFGARADRDRVFHVGAFRASQRLVLAPDGRQGAWVSARGLEVVELPDVTPRVLPLRIDVSGQWLPAPVWSPDSRTVAVSDMAFTKGGLPIHDGFELVDVATGTSKRVPHRHWSDAMAWSPDGETIAVTAPEGGVDVLARDGRLVRHLPGKGRLYGTHVWSPDGTRLLLYVGDDGPATAYTAVVDAATGRELSRLRADATLVWADATHLRRVSSDGKAVEQIGLDGRVTRTIVRVPMDSAPMLMAVRPAS